MTFGFHGLQVFFFRRTALIPAFFFLAMSSICFAEGNLGLEQQVACQAALEDIAWDETLWPEANKTPKPVRSSILSDEAIQARVEDRLRMEAALAEDYGVSITSDLLQNEINRMASHSKAPDRLRRRFAALGNDAARIAECMARPYLVGKKLRQAYVWDRNQHAVVRQRAAAALNHLNDVIELANSGADDQTVVLELRDDADAPTGDDPTNHAIALDADAFAGERKRLESLASNGAPNLRETETAFVHETLLAQTAKRIELRRLVWRKRGFEDWWANQRERWPAPPTPAIVSDLALPLIAGNPSKDLAGAVMADSWRVETDPTARYLHTAVWTGSEMIVWGGHGGGDSLNSGWRYNPSTESWTVMTVSNAPSARYWHSAVWTGTEMIVWGGYGNTVLNSGARYSPVNDIWLTTSTSNAPAARSSHTAVWTGTEMIVWGGYGGGPDYNDGARYNPGTDTWIDINNSGAPNLRSQHTAVWTGSEMIIWGGANGDSSGGRYNPGTDTWLATELSGAPNARYGHTALWTGTQMIIWGGYDGFTNFNSGGRYNPSTNTWTGTSLVSAPSARIGHAVTWTGVEMIVWGGDSDGTLVNSGGRYNPGNDTWTITFENGAPSARWAHTMVWTGNEMIVWGGEGDAALNSGGRYNPGSDSWTAIGSKAPSGRMWHTAVWTGSEMIAWGGFGTDEFSSGGRYNPSTDTWEFTSEFDAPGARHLHTAIWTGSEMIVWGGMDGGTYLNSGGRYNPINNTWLHITIIGAPSARHYHTAVWTGSEMIVWGGFAPEGCINSGARYNPGDDSWVSTDISDTDLPSARCFHTAVWTGSEMIIWGGSDVATSHYNSGGRYSPSTDSWISTDLSDADLPSARVSHTAVWSGDEMIVWGGLAPGVMFSDGGRYDPNTNAWTAVAVAGAPSARDGHTAIWTGNKMIVWGGREVSAPTSSGGSYDPSADSWMATANIGAPAARQNHTAVWTGNEMIIWGGASECCNRTNSMGIYYPYNDAIFADGFDP